jgi:Lecithin retinol acyltransferase
LKLLQINTKAFELPKVNANAKLESILGKPLAMAKGDHLLVKRKKWLFSYFHHGIDAGGDTVIHLTGPRKKDAKVIESSMAEFLKGGTKEVWEYMTFISTLRNSRCDTQSNLGRPPWMLSLLNDERITEIEARIDDPERAVVEARKHLGRRGYNLFSDNCEHFAVYCKTGLAVSLQAIEYEKLSDRVLDLLTRSQRRY